MARWQIGVCLKSLGLPLRRGLGEARRLRLAGVELEAAGELSPKNLSQTGRRYLRHMLKSHDLALTALACPLRHGLDHAPNLDERLDHVRNVLTLSYELGAGLVIVTAGRIPEKADDPRAALLAEALNALGRHGDRVGATLALETGLDNGEVLRDFLARFDSGSLAVNFNPANLLMNGFDPYDSARALSGRIVHGHAKDARQATASRTAQEVPLGHGDIDWLLLLGLLEEIGYRGWLAIEREQGEGEGQRRLADIAAGADFLRRLAGG